MSHPQESHVPAPSGGSHEAPHDAEHFHCHTRLYVGVGVALLICTGLTVGISYIHFGSEAMNIFMGLLLATFKAALVAAIFMHLKGERKDIFRFMIPTMIFLFALIGLCILAIKDHIHF